MTRECIKCGDEGSLVTITMEDGEFSSKFGDVLCADCYDSLMQCIVDMIYEDEAN